MATGSLINSIYGGSKPEKPEVGMGATILYWSDRHACTIVDVLRNGNEIIVQEDEAIRTDDLGMSDSQTYEYKRNEGGVTHTFTLRKNGAWVRSGSSMKNGTRLLVGKRDHHYDFSF